MSNIRGFKLEGDVLTIEGVDTKTALGLLNMVENLPVLLSPPAAAPSPPHVVSPPSTEAEIAASDNKVIREGAEKVAAEKKRAPRRAEPKPEPKPETPKDGQDPWGLAPAGENVDEPAKPRPMVYDESTGTTRFAEPHEVAAAQARDGVASAPAAPEAPAVAPAPAPAAAAPQAAAPAPKTDVAVGGYDVAFITGAQKLKDILQHLLDHGVEKANLARVCEELKPQVGLLSRIPNIEERVARTLDVMGI